jgi:hypothetical protein
MRIIALIKIKALKHKNAFFFFHLNANATMLQANIAMITKRYICFIV